METDEVSKFLLKFLHDEYSAAETSITYVQNLSYKKKTRSKELKPNYRKLCTMRDMKKLGLLKSQKYSVSYTQAKKMNQLWKSYISKLIQIESKKALYKLSPFKIKYLCSLLHRIDLHGCQIVIVRAKNDCLVGLKGIVIIETKNTFIIVQQDNATKTIPKFDSVIEVEFANHRFSLYGTQINARPLDRVSKKLKKFTPPNFC